MNKLMALDIGTKRIGIALSDYLQVLSVGHSYIPRMPEDKALEQIYRIAKENNVKKIIVGLPLNMNGSKGAQADDCAGFASKIQGYEVLFEDERLTSFTAEENLRLRRVNIKKDKGLVDIESACIILEQYLLRKK